MGAPAHRPAVQIDPDKVADLLAHSADLCRETRMLLGRSQGVLGRRDARPRLRAIGSGRVATKAAPAEHLFAMADEVEAAIRTWHDSPAAQREAIEVGLYEAAELIRKTARTIPQRDV